MLENRNRVRLQTIRTDEVEILIINPRKEYH